MKRIEFTGGGPLDGAKQFFGATPEHNWEMSTNTHSYTYDAETNKFRYSGRWRSYDLGKSFLTYRTYAEAVRQLGQLQYVGVLTAAQSLEIQAKIKEELFAHGRV